MHPVFYQRRLTPNFGIGTGRFYRLLKWGLIVFIGWVLVSFLRSQFAQAEAQRYSDLAAKQLAANKSEEARASVVLALGAYPEHVDAARLLARMLDAEGDARSTYYHQIVTKSSRASIEDFKNLAKALVKNGDYSGAQVVAERVADRWKEPAYPHLIKADSFARQGDVSAQEKELRLALEVHENQATLSALLQYLMSQSGLLPVRAPEIARLLQQMAKFNNAQGLEALRLGLVTPDLVKNDRMKWIEQYRSHPAATSESLLLADEIQAQMDPSVREGLIQAQVKRVLGLRLDQREPVIRWMLKNDRPEAALAILTLPEAIQSREAFLLWIEAASRSNRWSEMEVALRNPANPLPARDTLPFLAQSLKMRGDLANAETIYRKAIALHESQPELTGEIFRHLILAGERGLVRENLDVLFEDPKFALGNFKAIASILRNQRDSQYLLEFLEGALKSPLLKNDVAVLDSVASTKLALNLPVSLAELEFRASQHPNNVHCRMTYALGLLCEGRKAKAIFELENGEHRVNASNLDPWQKAIFASALAANNRLTEAQSLASSIPPDSLTTQEFDLLNGFLSSSARD
jgi:Tfp pilus assembly protein PilF